MATPDQLLYRVQALSVPLRTAAQGLQLLKECPRSFPSVAWSAVECLSGREDWDMECPHSSGSWQGTAAGI